MGPPRDARDPPGMRRGTTLVELALALALAAIALAVVAPVARSALDRMAVVAAREAVAGLFSQARAAARVHGAAVVRVQPGPWRARAEAGGRTLRTVWLAEEMGVSVSIGRGRDSTLLRFDALGLGRVASETLTFRRGAARAGLTLSSYGRVRRR